MNCWYHYFVCTMSPPQPPSVLPHPVNPLHDSMAEPIPSQPILIPPLSDRSALDDPSLLLDIYIHRASFRPVTVRLRSGQSPFPQSPTPSPSTKLCFIILERLSSKSTVSKSANPTLPLDIEAENQSFQVSTPLDFLFPAIPR